MALVQRVREKFEVGEEYDVKPLMSLVVKWSEEARSNGRDKCLKVAVSP